MTKLILVPSLAALVLLGVCSCSSPSNTGATSANAKAPAATSPALKPEITTTADALYKEYKADTKAANKYQGKVVEISGRFGRSKLSGETLEVYFDTGDVAVDVWCKGKLSDAPNLSKIEKGQQIKMVGIGDPMNSIMGPLFKDCQFQP